MFHHLSAPPRAARLKGCTAEPWKAASPNWEPNIPRRSTRLTTWPLSWRGKASWRRRGWGSWGAERWPSWHCREEGISHVARTRRVSLLFPVSPEQFGNVNWCLGWCTDRFWFEFDGEAFLARGNRLKLSVGQHCCWWIYCEIIELTTKTRAKQVRRPWLFDYLKWRQVSFWIQRVLDGFTQKLRKDWYGWVFLLPTFTSDWTYDSFMNDFGDPLKLILRFAGFGVWTINVPHCTNNTLPFTSCGSQHEAHLATA